MKEVISVSHILPYEPYGFTNCVRYGDTLYLSGISGLNVDGSLAGLDIESQTWKTYENIEIILQAAGSGLEQILQMTSFIVNLADNGSIYVATRKKILASPAYTSATIGVAALMIPGLLLEVQCIAGITK
ncbi:Rid family hydrolase [Thermosynechococcaceae cyanobacterium BACA0444]|uniref:Rid family hydrolase n=1 Tax=Pseudocalidococcus azoricus BACA0444 TaxID=2918990 RepID=A0AAE4FP90_9CYAN|nr:Rid family hydrolase [Pseudocalidococcus azoricus]MDS3859209.1 Rid family hydrolase [Pseudocalidococcus azoricus BACA0444]